MSGPDSEGMNLNSIIEQNVPVLCTDSAVGAHFVNHLILFFVEKCNEINILHSPLGQLLVTVKFLVKSMQKEACRSGVTLIGVHIACES
jgi:hypothetical protein